MTEVELERWREYRASPQRKIDLENERKVFIWVFVVLLLLLFGSIGGLVYDTKTLVCVQSEPGICHHGPPVSHSYPCMICSEWKRVPFEW